MNFERIKKNYDTHLWTKDMVKVSVRKNIITPEQYKLITKEEYTAE